MLYVNVMLGTLVIPLSLDGDWHVPESLGSPASHALDGILGRVFPCWRASLNSSHNKGSTMWGAAHSQQVYSNTVLMVRPSVFPSFSPLPSSSSGYETLQSLMRARQIPTNSAPLPLTWVSGRWGDMKHREALSDRSGPLWHMLVSPLPPQPHEKGPIGSRLKNP